MANGMKIWLTAVATGLALVAIWKLPPEPSMVREVEVVPAEVRRAAELDGEYRTVAEALKHTLWADSLVPLAMESPVDGVALLHPELTQLGSEDVRRFERALRDEVDAVRGSDVTFGYVLQSSSHGRDPDLPPMGVRHHTETYAGVHDGRGYCLQVRVFNGTSPDRTMLARLNDSDRVRPTTNNLGVCRPYLRYGMPGADVQRWVERGGAAFAQETGDTEFDPSLLGIDWAMRRVFGMNFWGVSRMSLQAERCEAGYADACGGLFSTPEDQSYRSVADRDVIARSPVTAITNRYGLGAFVFDEEYLLWDLEQEFGPEAVASFWTSDAELEVAFEEAFGVPAGAWVAEWIDGTIGTSDPGPGLPRSASTGGTLTIALLLGLAWMRNRRRTVV